MSYLVAERATLTRDCDANISDSLFFTRCYIRLTSALVIITHHSSDRCSLFSRGGADLKAVCKQISTLNFIHIFHPPGNVLKDITIFNEQDSGSGGVQHEGLEEAS